MFLILSKLLFKDMFSNCLIVSSNSSNVIETTCSGFFNSCIQELTALCNNLVSSFNFVCSAVFIFNSVKSCPIPITPTISV